LFTDTDIVEQFVYRYRYSKTVSLQIQID